MITDITITPRHAGAASIEFIEDLDTLSESALCSCSAGDDNPF
jgi:hypothetical protein